MLGAQTILIAQAILTHLGERNRRDGAIIAMSREFGSELGRELCPEAGELGAEPEQILGHAVVYKDDIEVPTIITADGKAYDILPDWAHEGRVLNSGLIKLADMRDQKVVDLGKIPAQPVGHKG